MERLLKKKVGFTLNMWINYIAFVVNCSLLKIAATRIFEQMME